MYSHEKVAMHTLRWELPCRGVLENLIQLPRESVHTSAFMRFLASLILAVCVASSGWAMTPMSLVVGIDGLSPYGIMEAQTPNLDSLIRGEFAAGGYRGDYTPHAFAGGNLGSGTEQITTSGPGWSSILAGVWRDRHLVVDNSFATKDFQANPTYLEQLAEANPQHYAASVIRWTPIDTHIISTVNDLNSQMDYRSTPTSDAAVATDAATQIAGLAVGVPASVFVHFDDIDGAGHATGLHSANYLTAVQTVDSRVGQILTSIRNRSSFSDEAWQIIVVSDHGHRPSGGHGGQTELERTIPLIVAQRGAGHGLLLTRNRPRSIVDVVPTVLNHFGLPSPSYLAGQALGTGSLLPPTATLRQGLVSHLPLDGNAAAGVAGSNAQIVGQVQFTSGKFGLAAGVNTYGAGNIRLVDDLGQLFGGQTDISMSFWVRYEAYTGDPAFFSNKDWNSGSNTGINLALNPNHTLDFNTKGSAGTRQDSHPYEGLDPSIWQHIAFTIDRDGMTRLFIDGVLAGDITTSSQGSFDGAFQFSLLNDGTGSYNQGTVSGLKVDEFGAWNRLLTLDEIQALATQAIPTLPNGDFNVDGLWTCSDIDSLVGAVSSGANDLNFDLDGDRLVTLADMTTWRTIAGSQNLLHGAAYLVGDANLDGVVDGSDFNRWNANKFTTNPAWCQGDFNADSRIDGSDFGLWNSYKFQAADAVLTPEPEACGLLAYAALGIAYRRPRSVFARNPFRGHL